MLDSLPGSLAPQCFNGDNWPEVYLVLVGVLSVAVVALHWQRRDQVGAGYVGVVLLVIHWIAINVLHDYCLWWPAGNTLFNVVMFLVTLRFREGYIAAGADQRTMWLMRALCIVTLLRAVWSMVWGLGVTDLIYATLHNGLYALMILSVSLYMASRVRQLLA